MAPNPMAVTWGPFLPSWRVGSFAGDISEILEEYEDCRFEDCRVLEEVRKSCSEGCSRGRILEIIDLMKKALEQEFPHPFISTSRDI